MTVETPRRRNFLRFSLRTLLIGMVVCGVVLGIAARVHSRAQRQKQILEAAAKVGGNIRYDFECHSESRWYAVQRSLAPRLGADYVGQPLILNFPMTPPSSWREPLRAATVLQSIEYFSACCEDLKRADVEQLAKLSRLKQIHFHYNSDLPDLQPLARLQHLELLGLQSSGVTPAKLAALPQLPKLKLIDLCRSDATDEVIPLLATFPSLEELHVEGSEITAAGLAGLKPSRSLKLLHVDRTQASVQAQLPGVTISIK